MDTFAKVFGLATLIALLGAVLYNYKGVARLIQGAVGIVAGGLNATGGKA